MLTVEIQSRGLSSNEFTRNLVHRVRPAPPTPGGPWCPGFLQESLSHSNAGCNLQAGCRWLRDVIRTARHGRIVPVLSCSPIRRQIRAHQSSARFSKYPNVQRVPKGRRVRQPGGRQQDPLPSHSDAGISRRWIGAWRVERGARSRFFQSPPTPERSSLPGASLDRPAEINDALYMGLPLTVKAYSRRGLSPPRGQPPPRRRAAGPSTY